MSIGIFGIVLIKITVNNCIKFFRQNSLIGLTLGLLKPERNISRTIVLDLLHWTGKCDKWQKN
jgi:hypothetical protein